ncbi:Uncharacterised protein [Segatella copri]|nr:Uncharacterised protein [Segatella copri]
MCRSREMYSKKVLWVVTAFRRLMVLEYLRYSAFAVSRSSSVASRGKIST